MGGSVIALFQRSDELYALVTGLTDPYTDPTPQFVAALCANHAPTREKAAAMIRSTPSATLTPVLLERLSAEKNTDVRAQLIETLGFMQVTAAIPLLLPLVADRKALIRANVAEALGLIGMRNREVTEALLMLLTDRSRVVRCYAAEALGDVGEPEMALERLRERQKADRSFLVRVWCVFGRARMGERIDWATLRAALAKRELLVRRQALIVLRHLVNDANLPQVAELLRVASATETDERLQSEMEAILRVLDRTEAYP